MCSTSRRSTPTTVCTAADQQPSPPPPCLESHLPGSCLGDERGCQSSHMALGGLTEPGAPWRFKYVPAGAESFLASERLGDVLVQATTTCLVHLIRGQAMITCPSTDRCLPALHALHPACKGLNSVGEGCSSSYSTSQWASSQDVQSTNSYSLGASGEYDGAKVGTVCRQCADSTNEVPAPFPCISRHVLCRLNVTVYTVRVAEV